VSGRGVGMDVVKRNIGAMGGNVEIRSVPSPVPVPPSPFPFR